MVLPGGAEAGRSAKAYELLMKARGISGYERAPQALDLQQKLGEKGVAKGLRGGWQKLVFEGSQDALCVAISSDGKTALSGHEDKLVKVWELETGKLLKTLEGHSGPVTACCFLPDKARALSGSHDGSVRVWSLGTGQCLGTLVGHVGGINEACVLPDGKTAMTAGDDGTIMSWDLDHGKQRYSVHSHDGQVRALAVSPDGSRAFTAGTDGFVRCWDTAKGKMVKTDNSVGRVLSMAAPPVAFQALPGASHHPWILLACEDGRLVRWPVESIAPLSSLKGHSGPARTVRFTPDGKFALSSGDDKTLKSWALASSECVWSTEALKQGVHGASLSPDARYVLTAGKDGLRQWELDWKFEFPEHGEQAAKAAPASPRITAVQEDQSAKARTTRYVLVGVGISAVMGLAALGYMRSSDTTSGTPDDFTALTFEPRPGQAPAGGPQAESAPAPAGVAGEPALKAATARLGTKAAALAEPAKLDVPDSADFPESWTEGGVDPAAICKRGLDLEKQGKPTSAYAAYMAAAEAGNREAAERKVALNPRLGKDELVAAIRLSQSLQSLVRGGYSDPALRALRRGLSGPVVAGKAGIQWMRIPGGSFMMGSEDVGVNERPPHRVTVSPFQLTRTEVTFGQHKKCVLAGACSPPHVSDGSCAAACLRRQSGSTPPEAPARKGSTLGAMMSLHATGR